MKTKSLYNLLFCISLFLLWMFLLFTLPSCSKHHPHEPIIDVPPDTIAVIDTLIIHEHHDHPFGVACNTVDVTIEFILIGDQSAPNVYAIFRNGVEVDRIIIMETYVEPTELTFVREFLNMTLGEVIAIKKIEGSKAETIGSAIIEIKCS